MGAEGLARRAAPPLLAVAIALASAAWLGGGAASRWLSGPRGALEVAAAAGLCSASCLWLAVRALGTAFPRARPGG